MKQITHNNQPLTISVRPARVVLAEGQHHAKAHFLISNHGTKTFTVHTTVTDLSTLHGHCAITSASVPSGWTESIPKAFTLKPGQHERTVLVISAPASAKGSHHLAENFVATSAAPGHGNVSQNAAVGSQVVLNFSGKYQQEYHCAQAAPQHTVPPAPPGPPYLLWGGLAVLGLLLLVLGARWVRKHVRLT